MVHLGGTLLQGSSGSRTGGNGSYSTDQAAACGQTVRRHGARTLPRSDLPDSHEDRPVPYDQAHPTLTGHQAVRRPRRRQGQSL